MTPDTPLCWTFLRGADLNWVPDYAEGTLWSRRAVWELVRRTRLPGSAQRTLAPPSRNAPSLYPSKFLIYIQVLLFA